MIVLCKCMIRRMVGSGMTKLVCGHQEVKLSSRWTGLSSGCGFKARRRLDACALRSGNRAVPRLGV